MNATRLTTTGLLLAALTACSDAPDTAPKKAASTYDATQATAVISHYADIAEAAFSDALGGARTLQAAVDALLEAPSDSTLAAARDAWRDARVPYMQTEVFRFGNAVVDEWEGQVNAWPLDEGLIDYVDDSYQAALGNPGARANLIANTTLRVGEEEIDLSDLNGELLASLNELAGSEANVATGYHAIEFLLWGQDLNGTGPGAGERPASDFMTGEGATGGHNERRRDYLRATTALLISDLEQMVAEWQPDNADNYRATLLNDTPENGLRKMLFGMGSLSLGELAGERMKVALEAHSPEDEHDCFSDNTHHSHYYNGLGIANVYRGEYRRADGSQLSGPGLHTLVAANDAAADAALNARLDDSLAALQGLVDSAENDNVHFDQLIAPGNEAGNQIVRDAIAALVAQTAAIESAAAAIGITQLNPDTADHQF
jgi:putative iron-regulated protein